MKKLGKQFFQSILIVLLSLAIFLVIIAGWIKIDEYRKLSYKVDTKFENTDIVKLTNKLPLADDLGKNYNGTGMESGIAEYREFTVYNNNDRKVTYEIYLTQISGDNQPIKSNYIKLYLTDENGTPIKGFDSNKVKSYYDLYALNNKPGSRLLYRDTLISGGSKKYILKSWIADTYVLNDNVEDFIFDIDVRIK